MGADLDDIKDRVKRATAIAWLLAAVSLAALCTLPEQVQGWVSAVGAIATFGSSSLPAKHPAASAAGLGFQLWVTLGNFTLNTLLLLLLGVPLRWEWWGVVGALCLTATQIFAWPAIQALGAAVGPGIWCGIGMVSSFIWGVVIFGETMPSPTLAAGALCGLVVGVAAVATSQAVAQRAAAATATELPPASELQSTADASAECVESGVDESRQPMKAAGDTSTVEEVTAMVSGSGLAGGVLCAVCTGLLDGSLMAPFSAFRRSAHSLALSPDQVLPLAPKSTARTHEPAVANRTHADCTAPMPVRRRPRFATSAALPSACPLSRYRRSW